MVPHCTITWTRVYQLIRQSLLTKGTAKRRRIVKPKRTRPDWNATYGTRCSECSLASCINIPLNIGLGFAVGQDKYLEFWDAVIAFGIGSVLFGVGGIAHRVASSITSEVRIHSTLYLTPVLALILLAVFTSVEVARLDLFMLGASLTTVLIFLIQIDPERGHSREHASGEADARQRFGFISLVLSVWFSGTLIYLRDEFMPESWLSWSPGDYWAILTLSATVFALIFGFRVSRLSSRIDKEDDDMLSIYRRAELLVSIRVVDSSILKHLIELDRAHPSAVIEMAYQGGVSETSALERAYTNVLQDLYGAKQKWSYAESPELFVEITAIEIGVDRVVNSKQQGRDFAEFVSLMVFAIITVILGVSSRPAGLMTSTSSWQGMLTEVFSILFVSTIAFLAINLFDIRASRDLPLVGSRSRVSVAAVEQNDSSSMQRHEAWNPVPSSLHFRYGENVRFQRQISLAITVLMCATFVYLLYDKWM